MFSGMMENLGTIIVSLALIGLVVRIVLGLRKDRKQGKCSCGGSCGSCGSCPMSCSCRKPS